MTDKVRAGPLMRKSELFSSFWTCLQCDWAVEPHNVNTLYESNRPKEPCENCGYYHFKPKYHILISK